MTDQIPPHDIEAEETCLAAALIDPDAIDQVAFLQPEMFFREAHGWAWAAILDLHRAGQHVNQITVARELSTRRDGEQSQLDALGGQAHISDLIRRIPTNLGSEWYGRIVVECYNRRRIISQAHAVMRLAFEGNTPELASKASEQFLRLAADRARPLTLWPADVLDGPKEQGGGLHDELRAWLLDPTASMGITVGLDFFDDMLRGFHGGRLYTVLGNTSHGKSWLTHWLALQMALKGQPAWICSTEMSAVEIGQRLIAMIAQVDRYKVDAGEASDAEKSRLLDAEATYRELPIGIMSIGRPALSTVLAEARRQARTSAVVCAFVDHIQHIRPDRVERNSNEAAWLAEVVGSLKGLASNEFIAVWSVSHISRADAKAGGAISTHAGKGSGAIEQDSDVVLSMQAVEWCKRKDQFGQTRTGWWDIDERRIVQFQQVWNSVPILLDCGKNRHGPKPRQPVCLDWGRGGNFGWIDSNAMQSSIPNDPASATA